MDPCQGSISGLKYYILNKRTRQKVLKTGSADPDPDPKKWDRIHNTADNLWLI